MQCQRLGDKALWTANAGHYVFLPAPSLSYVGGFTNAEE